MNGKRSTSKKTSHHQGRSSLDALYVGLTLGLLLGGSAAGVGVFVLRVAPHGFPLLLIIVLLLLMVVLVSVFLVALARWRRELQAMWTESMERWQESNIRRVGAQVGEYLSTLEQRYLEQMSESMTRVGLQVAELRLKETLGISWLETLYHAFTLLQEAENEEALYENIVTAFAMLDGYTQVLLLLGQDELGPLRLTAALGLPQESLNRWLHQSWRPPLWGVVAPALAKKKPFLVQEDASEMRSFKEEFPWPVVGDRALALPLLGTQAVQGVVLLVRQGEPPLPNQLHIRLLEMVALFAGRTLENWQLVRGVQTHIAELLTVQSITKTLISAPSLEALVQHLSVEITSILGPCSLALILREDVSERRMYTSPPMPMEEATFVDWRVVQWVCEASQPVFYTPGQVGEDVGDLIFESSGSAMAVPLEGVDRSLGVLVVASQMPGHVFEEPQMVGVRTIANTAVVGLYALRFREQLTSVPGKMEMKE